MNSQLQKEVGAVTLKRNFPTLKYFKPSQLRWSKRYAEVNPRLDPTAKALVKDDIRKKGFLQPITINGKGVILDGYNRVEIAMELGDVPIPVVVLNFKTLKAELIFVQTVNIVRRQMNSAERTIALANIYPGFFTQERMDTAKHGVNDEIAIALGMKPNAIRKARSDYAAATHIARNEGFPAPTREHLEVVMKMKAAEKAKHNTKYNGRATVGRLHSLAASINGKGSRKARFEYVEMLVEPVTTLQKEIQKRIKKGK